MKSLVAGRRLAAVVAVSLAVFAAPFAQNAAAEEAAEERRPTNPCGADIERLCGDQPPGRGRVRQCMEAKIEQLTPGCRASFDRRASRAKERYQAILAACGKEAESFCADVPARRPLLLRCLGANAGALSETCLAVFPKERRVPGRLQRDPEAKGQGPDGESAPSPAAGQPGG